MINKIFTLFLCKVYDETSTKEDDEFQWKEGVDNHVAFQLRLTNLPSKMSMIPNRSRKTRKRLRKPILIGQHNIFMALKKIETQIQELEQQLAEMPKMKEEILKKYL